MGDEVLALGQREIDGASAPADFTGEELVLLADNDLSPADVIKFAGENGKQTINAAIGGVKTVAPIVGADFTEKVAGVDEAVAVEPTVETVA